LFWLVNVFFWALGQLRRDASLDDGVEVGTRNLRVALRKLRKLARQGAEDELDLDDMIRSTAERGFLDIKMSA